MNAYSKDLRLKVLSAVERGVPRPSPGRTSKILDDPDHRRTLWRQLEENDTATLREHSEMFEKERGISVSVATMSRAVRTLGWTFKKDRWHPPSATSEGGALLRAT